MTPAVSDAVASSTRPATTSFRGTGATMRAAVVTAPRKIEVRDGLPLPTPADVQVRVRVEGCGVCSSNIPPWEGRDWFSYPFAPGQMGHEAWGTVDAVGKAVTKFKEGDRVAFLSNNAYASHDVAHESATLKLPASLNGTPFPAEPLACAMNIFGRGDVRPGQTVAVVGVGFLGAMLIGLAKSAGARVIAITQRPFSQRLAKQVGADHVVPLSENWPAIQEVAGLTDGTGGYEVRGFCDRVIECTGKQTPLDLAAEICGVRGRLVIAGYHQDGLRQVNLQVWNWRGLDVINAHERDPAAYLDGMRQAIDAVAAGRLNPTPLITHRYSLDQLAAALDATRERPDGFVKAIVEM
jgi:threonine dehydrogenase-like Zn-dependent dehydrogenase